MRGTCIRDWPRSERPRERLFKYGEHTLSNAELLAVLFGSGSRGTSALDLGRDIITHFKTFRNMSHADIQVLREFNGMADARIAMLRALFEIARRFMSEKRRARRPVNSPKEAASLLMPRLRDLKKEIFKLLLLDSKNNIIDILEIDEGTVDSAAPQIREIMVKALQNFASSIIAAHNHPSGDPEPSEEDITFTKGLTKAGEVLQLNVLDHIIIGDNRFYSFADSGRL
ncbi:MAG: DNA repair protein RadC [Candidatus Omnitrophica bacterium]|nr:DNA repair protein RadC [Candidatus Omnitrophota bacterium]MBU4149677.1 DNA repair protein RadC [Candidatus Omnitrophota bacterium]